MFSELSSDRPADPVPAAPKTDPDLVREHEIIPALPVEPDSAPPSIPSAASVTAEDAPKPQGSIPVLPGHVIANRYEVLGILGEGGMGIVYRCRDQSRPPAICRAST